jgi:O-antigen ligase
LNLRNIGLAFALLVPFGLLHAFVFAEICIAITDILFLAESFRNRSFAWAREPWFIAAMAWWLWLLVCSLPILGSAGWHVSFAFALVIIRFILFTAALQSWLFTTETARRIAWLLLAVSCLWIGVESWQQFLTGHNIFGDTRFRDGALTGPFWKPRAGALFGHLLFIAMSPPAALLLARREMVWRLAGGGLMSLGIITSVLIGQRMGLAFSVLGDVAAALLIPRLRLSAMVALVAGGITLVATPVISPPTHGKLVGETATNMDNFTQSPYGELFSRAMAMGVQSPWHGWGYNGFRAFCPQDRFAAGVPMLGIPSTQFALGACNLHPHNFYLQAFEESGVPGLALFVAMNLAWVVALMRGLRQSADPLRVGLFIGVLTYVWPLASTDDFPTLYEPGWLFFILGLALALHAQSKKQILSADYTDFHRLRFESFLR